MHSIRFGSMVAAAAGLLSGSAWAGVIITQGSSAPTYGTTLNFDEPGTPTGVVPTTQWLGSHGVTIDAGDGVPYVAPEDLINTPWINSGNSFFGNYGVFATFSQPLTALSVQVWDPSGPPSPFGGGLGVFLFSNGNMLDDYGFGEPAWGGIGDSWWNITTTAGTTFDEVRILGFGFFPTTYADNFSWQVVPEPTSLGLFGLGALTFLRRTRR